ncbi:DUF3316 domain-containing protein [Vibrio makurazakiensis]|uniref:DUF3316 domain-containing protein n=1 Tax=Vibrio makurazakiensis TaxID=2910250 RepID=UPI003D12284E
MKKLIAIACGLLVAFSVTAASRNTIHSNSTMVTESFSSKQDAMDAGFNMYESLETASDSELRWKLNKTNSDVVSGSMTLDNARVKIEENIVSRDNIEYRAIVDVDYHYTSIEKGSD